VVVGNEVLDAMPVKLLVRKGGVWHERGVALREAAGCFVFEDRPTALRPPVEIEGEHDYLTEIHPQAQAFMRTLADRLEPGAAFFLDYGFPEAEYYHPQRHMGTLMCHRGHLADPIRWRPSARRTSPRTSTSPASRWRRRRRAWPCWATRRRRAS
jgi:SAM-dependent MidA family methyltransferase